MSLAGANKRKEMAAINKTADRKSTLTHLWPIGAIVLLTLATYANSLTGNFVWDDQVQVLRNVQIRDFQNLPGAFAGTVLAFANQGLAASNYYRPLQTAGYMVAYAIGGISPWPYHLLNVLLHTITTIFVYLLCREFRLSSFASILAGLIFAVHPIHTEVVAWIAGLPDAGCGAFYLMSLWCYLRYVRSSDKKWLGLSSLAFLVALLFKEMALTLPGVILALMVFQRRVFNRKLSAVFLELSPYALIIAANFGVRLALFGFIVTTHVNIQASYWDWISLGIHAFGQYIRYVLLPYPLSAFHLIPIHFSDRVVSTFLYGCLIVLACGTVWLARKRIPTLALWLVVLALMLVPVFNFRGISVTFFAERYLYIPSFAVAIALALAIEGLSRRPRFVLSTLLVALFAIATFQRNTAWSDNVSLYNATLQLYPEAVAFRLNLGEILISNNQDAEAKAHFEQALAHLQNSIYFHPPKEDARAYLNLGALAGRAREFDQAKQYLEKALQINPDSAAAYTYMGGVLIESDRNYDAAMTYLGKAIEMEPVNDVAHDYMGTALFNLDRYPEAAQHFQTALGINPSNKEAQQHLALANERVLQANESTYTGLALTAARSGKFDEARRFLERALEINPRSSTAYVFMGGVIMESQRDFASAMTYLTKALELDPGNDVAHDYMGSALFNLRRYEEASRYFERALAINPSNAEARQHLKMVTDTLKAP